MCICMCVRENECVCRLLMYMEIVDIYIVKQLMWIVVEREGGCFAHLYKYTQNMCELDSTP